MEVIKVSESRYILNPDGGGVCRTLKNQCQKNSLPNFIRQGSFGATAVIERMDEKMIGLIDPEGYEKVNRVYDTQGASPTITARDYKDPVKILTGGGIRKLGNILDHEGGNYSGNVSVQKDSMVLSGTYEGYAIRKLTSRECFRLMGMSDADYDKAASVVSETRRYQAAGDAIVVTVLMAIFSQLNIQGMPMWNDMANDARYALIEGKHGL